jgi:hypothetical protein
MVDVGVFLRTVFTDVVCGSVLLVNSGFHHSGFHYSIDLHTHFPYRCIWKYGTHFPCRRPGNDISMGRRRYFYVP